jgi:NADH:ubiquinone oxidoreductase subunit 5 (subunit L)/multisubunit Na+/H+ antiporter MnhA subunit
MAHGGGHEAAGHGAEHLAHRVAMFGGMAAVGVGILLSWLMYGRRSISAEAMGRRFAPLYTLFRNKYYFDEAYSALIVRPVLALSRAFLRFDLKVIDGAVNGSAFLTRFLSFVVGVFDAKVVDGAANGAADVCRGLGAAIRRGQTGRFQSYAMGLAALSFLLILVRILGRF